MLNNGFVADDFCWLEEATLTQDRIVHLFNLQISNFFRPLVHLLFYLEWNLFGKWAPGYYGVNLILLLSCIGLFYLLVRRIHSDSRIAFLAGLIFSIQFSFHEAVLWISGVTSLLAGLWLLISMHCFLFYLSRGKVRWMVLTLVAFAGGTLTKETSVIIPPLLLVVAVYVQGRKGWSAWGEIFPVLLSGDSILSGISILYSAFSRTGCARTLSVMGGRNTGAWDSFAEILGPKGIFELGYRKERSDRPICLRSIPIGALCLMAGLGCMIRSLEGSRKNFSGLQ